MKGARVSRSLTIPDDEIEIRFDTSGGPGGQHANRAATRVTVIWNVPESRALGPRQRARLLRTLGPRLDRDGRLQVTSSRRRSQLQNRNDAIERLCALVAAGLATPRRRIATVPSKRAQARRLEEKKRRSQIKRMRGRPESE